MCKFKAAPWVLPSGQLCSRPATLLLSAVFLSCHPGNSFHISPVLDPLFPGSYVFLFGVLLHFAEKHLVSFLSKDSEEKSFGRHLRMSVSYSYIDDLAECRTSDTDSFSLPLMKSLPILC